MKKILSRFPVLSFASALLTMLGATHNTSAQAPLPSPTVFPHAAPSAAPARKTNPSGPMVLRTDNSLEAVITSKAGQTIAPGSCRGVASRVGLNPGQVVTVTLRFAAGNREPVTVEALDGGTVTTASPPVLSSAGVLRFEFKANPQPGLTQVRVRVGESEYGVQFYVLDPEHPEQNPILPKLGA